MEINVVFFFAVLFFSYLYTVAVLRLASYSLETLDRRKMRSTLFAWAEELLMEELPSTPLCYTRWN